MTDPTLDSIGRLDEEIIRLWRERAALTSELIRIRTDLGLPGYRHAEQLRLVTRYREMLDTDGVQLAQLLTRHVLNPARSVTPTADGRLVRTAGGAGAYNVQGRVSWSLNPPPTHVAGRDELPFRGTRGDE
jgi:chorismate mutase